MRLPSTMLPTTRISNDGNAPSLSVERRAPPLTKSAHVSVLAGIWMIMLQGTMIVDVVDRHRAAEAARSVSVRARAVVVADGRVLDEAGLVEAVDACAGSRP